jgi:hypothetical protein
VSVVPRGPTECPVEISEEEVERQYEDALDALLQAVRNTVAGYLHGALNRFAQLYRFVPIVQYRMEPLAEPGKAGTRIIIEVYLDDEQLESLYRTIARQVCERRARTVTRARAVEMVKTILAAGQSYVRGAENTGPGKGGAGAGGGRDKDGAPQGGHSAEGAGARA